ncbi:hypothetical protein LEP1GSC047_3938 [Leptospira inadai serovar Lyme str. 10]|uniref:Medium/long-chain acyl-CoA thioesterase YigI n=2 Tax=Leptospira inadai serovar Lyme TaxID=293084 RepID=V6HML3_9LEPT|nr:hotdog fold thioesterase [Leptospira inadai]EQA38140.1 hypothetical protein LEP1GSC047_3938 [Leptospira inadai serovar Lyme str. 10]PNV75156.1 phenylacetic acid degradation protein PaaI [Leptospira inadai serovar Lyme]
MSREFKPRGADYKKRVKQIFLEANFIRLLEIELLEIEPGLIRTSLTVQDKHKQQNNFVHAGVISTLADHSAGAAAGTLIGEQQVVLTLEFKVNLLRPGIGDRLRCQAKVIYQGKTIIVAESEVFAEHHKREKLIAKATVTLAVLGKLYG